VKQGISLGDGGMKKQFLNSASAAVLATVFSVAAVSSPAMAAPPPPPPLMSVYNWTGFYVGGNVGYGFGSGTPTYTDPSFGLFGLPTSFTGLGGSNQLQSPIGGIQAGYNWRINQSWVTGLEADFQGSAQKANRVFNFPFFNDGEGGTLSGTLTSKIHWFGTVRGRIGFLVNPMTMVYGTGGLAYGKVSVAGSFFDSTLGCLICSWAFDASTTKVGWAAGAGIEGAFPVSPGLNTKNWTWKFEYLHIDLGTFSGTGFNPDFFGPFAWSAKFTNDIVRFGVNYAIRP
jgi:outer membrane immunogenic protein